MKRVRAVRIDSAGRRRSGLISALCWLWLALPPSEGATAADLASLKVGEVAFRIETALTESERRLGLMYRSRLPTDQGMLFIQPPGPAEFWMKNTLIPLDLLYFDSDGTLIEILSRVQPCKQRDCPIYPSESTAVRYILEINGGEAERRGIRVGDRLGRQ
jgi:hypothetical protein